MQRILYSLLGVALLAVPASGQGVPTTLDPAPITVDVAAGALQGANELARETRFDPSLAYGGSLTYWVEPALGVGVYALYSDRSVSTLDNVLSGQELDMWLLGADVTVRGHLRTAGRSLVPYMKAGLGTKRYGFDEAYYAPAASLKAGVALPLGRMGLFLEGGPVYSELHDMGFWEDQIDWLYGGGLSIPLGGSATPPDVAASAYDDRLASPAG